MCNPFTVPVLRLTLIGTAWPRQSILPAESIYDYQHGGRDRSSNPGYACVKRLLVSVAYRTWKLFRIPNNMFMQHGEALREAKGGPEWSGKLVANDRQVRSVTG